MPTCYMPWCLCMPPQLLGSCRAGSRWMCWPSTSVDNPPMRTSVKSWQTTARWVAPVVGASAATVIGLPPRQKNLRPGHCRAAGTPSTALHPPWAWQWATVDTIAIKQVLYAFLGSPTSSCAINGNGCMLRPAAFIPSLMAVPHISDTACEVSTTT